MCIKKRKKFGVENHFPMDFNLLVDCASCNAHYSYNANTINPRILLEREESECRYISRLEVEIRVPGRL